MKYSISFLIMMLIAGKIYSEPALMIGVNGNVTTITGNDPMVQSSALRLGFGVRAEFEQNFSKHFSLITGIGFAPRGEKNTLSKSLTETINQETIEKIKILSLQIPILPQVNFPFSAFRLSLFGGPELGFLIKCRKINDKTVYVPETDDAPGRVDKLKPDTINFQRDIKMLDLGITAGIGFEVNTGSIGAFFVRPAVYIGLIDILQFNHDAEANTNLNGKHQALSVAFGYKFNIKSPREDDSEAEILKSKEEKSSSEQSDYNLDEYRNFRP